MKAGREKGGKAAYLIALGAGALLWFLLMLTRGGFEAATREAFWHTICDAFFVPGVLLTCLGLLVFAANGGVFDMLSYGIQKALRLVQKKEKRDLFPKTFFDYKVIRHGKQRGNTAAPLVCGLLFLAAAGLCLIPYFQGQ